VVTAAAPAEADGVPGDIGIRSSTKSLSRRSVMSQGKVQVEIVYCVS